MVVYILDLDWAFDKNEMPSIECMRLSSFHKQRKDSVFLITEMSELMTQYDKLYIFSNSDSTPNVGSKILNDKKTVLLGKKYELCGAKKLGAIISGCRPDYLLYDIKNEQSNSYSKANFITFFTSEGGKVSSRQAWKNTKKGVKRTIVTDDCLWEQSIEDIIHCLQELQTERNIVFLNPISLKILIEQEQVRKLFFSLHFSKGTKFKWRNNMPMNSVSAQKISHFLLELKTHTLSDLGSIPIKPIENTINWQDEFSTIIQLIAIYKQNKIKCFLPPSKNSEFYLNKWISSWCTKGHENSFIEEMVFFTSARKGKRWFNIINSPQEWNNDRTRFIIKILQNEKFKFLLPFLAIQWGGNSIDISNIDFTILNKNAYLII